MKKVLIALDYNPSAQKVAEAGYELAKCMGADIILLHVTDSPNYYSTNMYDPFMGFGGYTNLDYLDPNINNLIKDQSMEYLNKTRLHLGNEFIDTIVKEGNIAETILEEAKKLEIDIIVMGTHSQKWLEALLLGSETRDVISSTTIPVLIVPTKNQTE